MITVGLRLRDLATERFTWRDLKVFLVYSPRESAYARELLGESASWDLNAHLVATVVDLLAAANWQRAGKKNAPKPKPLRRPGHEQGRRVGTQAIAIKEFDAWWNGGE